MRTKQLMAELPDVDVPANRRENDEHAVVVSSDAHAGPLLSEHLRDYCPKRYLEEFDKFVDEFRNSPKVAGAAGEPPPAGEIRTSSHRNALTDGGWDISARLRDMDYDGVAAEVVFHGLVVGQTEPIPFATRGHHPVGNDLELAAVGFRIYNRWLADFVSVEPDRHAGLAQLPMWDVDAAVAEVEWARAHGLRGVNFPRPRVEIPLAFNRPEWEPFWSVCDDLQMPLTTHAQSAVPSPASIYQGDFLIKVFEVAGYAARRGLHYLVFGGVFDRHPGLKLVFTEQPGDWWTSMMAEMDSVYLGLGQDGGGLNRNGRSIERLPSEYALDHVFVGASCLAPFEAKQAVNDGYGTQVMWGSDYPHPEGSYQYPRFDGEESMTRLHLQDTFSAVAPNETALMAGENAARVYGLDLVALQKVADRINAPTFGQLTTPLEIEPEDRSTRGADFCFRRHGPYH